jgi:hypothetical protein
MNTIVWMSAKRLITAYFMIVKRRRPDVTGMPPSISDSTTSISGMMKR